MDIALYGIIPKGTNEKLNTEHAIAAPEPITMWHYFC